MQAAASIILPAEVPAISGLTAITPPDRPGQTASTGDIDNHPSPLTKDLDIFPAVLPQPALPVVPVHRRRRSSKINMPAIIKRSASTPNVRGQAAADAAALSLAAEKRRNKLGYHRTSVACGHCRRRKIRCLLAPEDPTGRCLNCIRLKKECNFFPVDQQPQPDHSSRAGSKAGRSSSGNNSSTSSPSPPLQPGSAQDHLNGFNQYSSVPLPAPHHQEFALPLDTRQVNGPTSSVSSAPRVQATAGPQRPQLAHMDTTHLAGRSFDFSAGERRTPVWDGSPYDQSPVSGEPKSALEDPSTNFWRLAESPMTPAFSAYGGPSPITPLHHREGSGAFSFSSAREDLSWPVPSSRPVSIAQFDGYPRDYVGNYAVQGDFKQPPPTSIYPPSLNTSNISMASISEPPSAVTDGPAQTLPGTFGTQSGWNPSFVANTMNGLAGKSLDGLGGWYTEPGHLAQVDEEGPGFHFHEEPPLIYQAGAQSAA